MTQGVLDGLDRGTSDAGSPQGAVPFRTAVRTAHLAPLRSNIDLNPLDHLTAESGYEMVRYARLCLKTR